MSREMKESGIDWLGKIPEDWSVISLKHLCKITTGNKDTIDREEKGQYPFYVRSPNIERINSYSFDGEAILTAGDGVGAGKVFHYVNEKFDYHQRVYNLHNFKNIYPKYLFHYMKENFIKIVERGNAKSTVDSIRLPMLKDFPVTICDVDTEKRISNFLDKKISELDSIIEKTKSTIEDYKLLKQSIITEAVTKGLDKTVEMKESGIEWIGEVPEHWEISRLRYLGILQNGISKGADSFGTGTPFVSYSDIYKNYEVPYSVNGLVEANENDKHSYSVVKGDVFFTRTSETIEEIGLTATCIQTIPDATFAGFLIRFRPLSLDKLFDKFSKYYFRSDIHRRYFVKEMNLVTRASLSQGLLKNLTVLLPPIKEQYKIGEYLESKCNEIDWMTNRKIEMLKELESYKKSLIYECVTGKIEVEQEILCKKL